MRKKNQTEKSNSFSTIKVPFVSNEIECPVYLVLTLDRICCQNRKARRIKEDLTDSGRGIRLQQA